MKGKQNPNPHGPVWKSVCPPDNRTCLTKWSRPKDPQKLHIMLRSKEIQEQMRKKVIEIYQSGKGYKAVSKALGLHYEPLSTNGENMEQWWTFPGVAGRPKLPQERSDDSSKRSQKTPQQHLKNCRPHLPQLRSVFMTPP